MLLLGRGTYEPCRTDGERGASLVIVTLLLPALLIMGAFAIDVGHLLKVRAHLQGTADASALAAATQLPSAEDTRQMAIHYAEMNYPDHGVIVAENEVELGHWSPQTRTFAATGSDAYPTGATPNAVRVFARRATAKGNAVPLFFGGLVGRWTSDVSALAVAWMVEGSLPGIFAGGTNCQDTDEDDAALMWDADDVNVFGTVHSNGFIWVDGDGNRIFDGDLTHVTGTQIKSGNHFPTPIQVEPQPFPLGYEVGHFQPGHINFAFHDDPAFHYYAGNQSFHTTPAEGLHVAEGNLTIDVDFMTGSFTFVSLTGRIKVHGDRKDLTAYYDDLLFYAPRHGSDVSCSEPSDIRLEDDDNRFTGTVLAPRGRIWIDGADDWELNGSLIGWAITMEGDHLTLRVDPDAGSPRLQLVN